MISRNCRYLVYLMSRKYQDYINYAAETWPRHFPFVIVILHLRQINKKKALLVNQMQYSQQNNCEWVRIVNKLYFLTVSGIHFYTVHCSYTIDTNMTTDKCRAGGVEVAGREGGWLPVLQCWWSWCGHWPGDTDPRCVVQHCSCVAGPRQTPTFTRPQVTL